LHRVPSKTGYHDVSCKVAVKKVIFGGTGVSPVQSQAEAFVIEKITCLKAIWYHNGYGNEI
jgi:hypothetical protein